MIHRSTCLPDAHWICGGLYQGSFPRSGATTRKCGVRHLLLCAKELQPPDESYQGIQVHRIRLDDDKLDHETINVANAVAVALAPIVRKGDTKLLVTCHMGINRSGLMSALLLRHAFGLSGDQCVNVVKFRRPGALTNPWFTRYLRSL